MSQRVYRGIALGHDTLAPENTASCRGLFELDRYFYLENGLHAPSKEQLFLGSGWEPARDVRGAFISDGKTELLIGSWALLRKFASGLTLTLSLSTPLP